MWVPLLPQLLGSPGKAPLLWAPESHAEWTSGMQGPCRSDIF